MKDPLIFRFDYNENLYEALQVKLSHHKITSALLSGIGGLQSVTLAFYDLNTKQYLTKIIEKPLELVSLNGTVALDQAGAVKIHAHVVVSDETYQAYGGHFMSGVVNATCEIVVTPLTQQLTRHHNEDTGLFVLNA